MRNVNKLTHTIAYRTTLLCSILFYLTVTCNSVVYGAETYGVTGVSVLTGEKVRGIIDDTNMNGTVDGVVEVYGNVVKVNGAWAGVGMIEAFDSDGVWYVLEVVE